MADLAAQRRRWARALMGKAGRVLPSYGSSAWLALPEGSAEKVAAVVVAAEAWARGDDELEDTLRAEVEALRTAHKAIEDAEYVARRDAHRQQWGGLRLVHGAYADSPEFRGGGRSA